ncbi:hypothetical protein [Streptomyces sp. NPDC053048]|uniref:hypothetical protein n=1 Tax=Streptomyces sp. NPDC053048 TaxID=3365694 RepID=UPI0037CE6DAE
MATPTPAPQSALNGTDSEPAVPTAPVVPAVPQETPEETAPDPEEVSTPGGLPVVPAVTVGTTGTIAGVSATGLAAGGGAALLLAGALVLVPAVVAVARAPRVAGAAGRARPRTPGRPGGVPTQRAGARPGATSLLRSAGAAPRRSGSGTRGSGAGFGSGALRSGRLGSGLGRAAQHAAAVRQARRQGASQTASVGRTAAGVQQTAARRELADARRQARQQRRAQQQNRGTGTGRGRLSLSKGTAATGGHRTPGGGQRSAHRASGGRGGAVGRMLRAGRGAAAQTLARARRQNGATTTAPKSRGTTPKGTGGRANKQEPRGFLARRRAAYRQARDQMRNRWRGRAQARIEERARTRDRRRALRRSAARFHARRALAALAATPLGVLAMVLWPLAKLLRIRPPRWGRAVWRGLSHAATQARVERDVAAYEEHDQAEADRAREQRPRPGDVDRPRRAGEVAPTTTQEADMTQGFDFREAAAEMLTQAQSAEPGGMMQVLAQIETLPEAMAAIAETFATVAATCSPDNMPLHPAVNDALQDLHKQLVSCVDAAEAVGELFHTHHEEDIARHTDGRTAEEMWDVSRNEE